MQKGKNLSCLAAAQQLQWAASAPSTGPAKTGQSETQRHGYDKDVGERWGNERDVSAREDLLPNGKLVAKAYGHDV